MRYIEKNVGLFHKSRVLGSRGVEDNMVLCRVWTTRPDHRHGDV